MKPTCNYRQSSFLVYSYLSFGMFGMFGIRDILLQKPIKAALKLLLLLGAISTIFFLLLDIVKKNSLGAILAGQFTNDMFLNGALGLYIIFSIIIIWEAIDSLNLLRIKKCIEYNLKLWNSEKSKILLTAISWTSILGVPFFLMKRKNTGIFFLLLSVCGFIVSFMMMNFLTYYLMTTIISIYTFIYYVKNVLNGPYKGDEEDIKSFNDLNPKVIYDSGRKFITILIWYVFGKYGFHDFFHKKWQAGSIKVLLQLVVGFSLMMIINPSNDSLIFYRVSFIVALLISIVLVFIDISYLFLNKYENKKNEIISFNS